MEKIALPKKIEFKNSSNEYEGFVTIEPLFPGYGNTIGNSLRRVLLSSLPGAAVVGVKIKGAKHEFMAMPGIKEDVIDIILNLKQLKLKILSETDEVIKLELNIQGKKQVIAKDIKKNSLVEISNPELILANIIDTTGNLSLEIYVAKGMGYSLVEKDKKEIKEVDYMEVDSIFSPVFGVNYKVENVRVGKMTNWDKLVIEVKTDGTISIEDAFNQSVKILVDQFSALAGIKNEDKEGAKDLELVEKVLNKKKVEVVVEEVEKEKTSKTKKTSEKKVKVKKTK